MNKIMFLLMATTFLTLTPSDRTQEKNIQEQQLISDTEKRLRGHIMSLEFQYAAHCLFSNEELQRYTIEFDRYLTRETIDESEEDEYDKQMEKEEYRAQQETCRKRAEAAGAPKQNP